MKILPAHLLVCKLSHHRTQQSKNPPMNLFVTPQPLPLSRIICVSFTLFAMTGVCAAMIPDSVTASSVTWEDAAFGGELGSMPLGNGDIASNVWIEQASGDLLFYIAKSDAFDQNSQPIKVGRVRMSFEPPLWTAGDKAFRQHLNLAGGSVDVDTATISVSVWVDAHAPVLRIQASSKDGSKFRALASLEMYRNVTRKTQLGRGFCNNYFDIPDTLVSSTDTKPTVTWFHRNDYSVANNGSESSFYSWAMQQAGVSPGVSPDPFLNLTFGASIFSTDDSFDTQRSESSIATGDGGVTSSDLAVVLHTAQTDSSESWVRELEVVSSQVQPSQAALEAHRGWWEEFWGRSFVSFPDRSSAQEQKNIESQYVYSRYLDACDGRNAHAAIKFNGQAFTVDMGKGPDARDWGACYWFQNTRQPYYNALAAGDLDIMRPLYAFYNKSIPVIRARIAAQFASVFPTVSGGVWPETMTQFGTYNEGDWGCGTRSNGVTGHGDSSNTFIRFHFTGSLELALFTLDDYIMTGDEGILESYGIPICETVLEFYRTRFPNKDSSGKTDMWPAQALETHQCLDPTSRSKCATNPSTDVSGLRAVLSRLLSLPPLDFVNKEMRTVWQAQLDALPELAIEDGAILAVAPGYTEGDHNSENTELYPVHPFRLYGNGKPDLEIAQKTYAKRKHPCNNGWCQDVIDAAMLNLTHDAQTMVSQRAAQTSMFRFPGFAGHMQDYEPSLDHFSFMRTGMHYMLLSPVDDVKQSMLLFPTWPVAWDVDFKLHGPLNTTVEASCINGTLTKLVVTPKNREQDVRVVNCK